jgi:hypothetical protein
MSDPSRQPSSAPPIGYDPAHASSLMGPPPPGDQPLPDLNQGNTGSSTSPAETGNAGPSTAAPVAGSVTPTTRITHDRNPTTSGRTSYSCAECKRLKLKCSRCVSALCVFWRIAYLLLRRSWPCTSCVRRGVEQICPNGAMTGGKGRR